MLGGGLLMNARPRRTWTPAAYQPRPTETAPLRRAPAPRGDVPLPADARLRDRLRRSSHPVDV